MVWKKFNYDDQFGEDLKAGTVVRIEEDFYWYDDRKPKKEKRVRYAIVGHINESKGTNDELTEDNITHFTEDFIEEIEAILEKAKNDFK